MPQRRSSQRSSQLSGPGAILVLILLAGFYLFQSFQDNQSGQNPSPVGTVVSGATQIAPQGGESGGFESISVWFTNPLSGKSSGGVENNLVQAINGARKSVDVAIYNLTIDNIGQALIQAKKRGVTVRVVMESEAMDKDMPRSLQAAGIPIVGDQREGLMHNKFSIIDGQEVWMGSMNYTATSAYKDFNNLARIRSATVAAVYEAEFEQMFTRKRFGPDKQETGADPSTTVGGVPVEMYFSPEDGAARHVTAELMKAKKSIDILAYSFTSDNFAQAIHSRADAGVRVRGVFDESQYQSNKGGEFDALKAAGYDVHLDGIPGLLHDKVFIIDGQVVITGSYNFSANAERVNDENLIIIRDPEIAGQYLRHFDQVYGNAQP